MKTDKERLAIRGKCISKIIDKIDKWVKEDDYLDIDSVDKLIDEELFENYQDLSTDDTFGIEKYVDDYIDVLRNKKGIIVKGCAPKKQNFPYQGPVSDLADTPEGYVNDGSGRYDPYDNRPRNDSVLDFD